MALTEEQKRLRAEAYGSSEVPVIVGKGYGSLIDLYDSKTNPQPDAPEDLDSMLAAELGTLEEEPIARIYARRTGSHLARVSTLRHPKRPLAIATPDRARLVLGAIHVEQILDLESLDVVDRLVEVKRHAAQFRKEYGPPGTGQVPEREAIQTTWQMGVTGVRVVDIPVLFVSDWSSKLEVFTVAFNQELFDWLYEAVERFHHDHVLARKPPPPDGSDEYDEVQKRIHQRDTRPHILAGPDEEALMLRFAKFREVARRAELLKKREGQILKNIIANASGLVSTNLGKLSWTRSQDSSEVDWQKAANEYHTLLGLCIDAFKRSLAEDVAPSNENIAMLETRLKEIVPNATKVKPGHRSLRFYPKSGSDADLELARLSLALDALESAT